MPLSKFNVLIIDSSIDIQRKLSEILWNENIDFKVAKNAYEGLQIAHEITFDLIICRYELKELSGFQMYRKLESRLINSGGAFFLLFKKYIAEDILIASEMGVDGFIFMPLNSTNILRKIKKHFKRVREYDYFDTQNFSKFFSRSPVAKFIAENLEIIQFNESFKKIFNINETRFENKAIQDLFLLNENEQNKLTFRKMENGLTEYCCFKNISYKNDRNLYFDLHLYGIAKLHKSRIIAEVIPVGQKDIHKTLNRNYFRKNNILNGAEVIKHSQKIDLSFELTKREKEIFDESAKGYPIKLIAAKLNLSERTVEKHRSNIMSKTNSHSILEAILLINNNSKFKA